MEIKKMKTNRYLRIVALAISAMFLPAGPMAQNCFCSVARQKSYPQVYDAADSQKNDLNTSTMFRQKNVRLFRELEDSLRVLKKEYADTLKKTMFCALRIRQTGIIDSVALQTSDTTDSLWMQKTRDKINSWKFSFYPTTTVVYIQKVTFTPPKKHPNTTNHIMRNSIWTLMLGVLVFGFVALF